MIPSRNYNSVGNVCNVKIKIYICLYEGQQIELLNETPECVLRLDWISHLGKMWC